MKIMQAHRLGIIFLLLEVNFGGIASFATMDEIVDGIDLGQFGTIWYNFVQFGAMWYNLLQFSTL